MADESQRSGTSGGIVIGFGLWLLGSIILGAVTGKMGLCLAVGIFLGLCFGGVTWKWGTRPEQPRQDAEPDVPTDQ